MNHCLALEGLQFYANHGYYAHEKEVGGNYTVDIYMYLPLEKAGKTDNLEDTVNYEAVYIAVKEIMENPKHLIESLAVQIIEKLEKEFKELHQVTVKVTKIQPPIKGNVERAYVELSKNFRESHTESNYWEQRAKY